MSILAIRVLVTQVRTRTSLLDRREDKKKERTKRLTFVVPDFYGEKIQSVAGYRRWLKDQRAFNRKKTAAFV